MLRSTRYGSLLIARTDGTLYLKREKECTVAQMQASVFTALHDSESNHWVFRSCFGQRFSVDTDGNIITSTFPITKWSNWLIQECTRDTRAEVDRLVNRETRLLDRLGIGERTFSALMNPNEGDANPTVTLPQIGHWSIDYSENKRRMMGERLLQKFRKEESERERAAETARGEQELDHLSSHYKDTVTKANNSVNSIKAAVYQYEKEHQAAPEPETSEIELSAIEAPTEVTQPELTEEELETRELQMLEAKLAEQRRRLRLAQLSGFRVRTPERTQRS